MKQGRDSFRLDHFFRLYSIGPKNPCPRMVSFCLTYVRFADRSAPLISRAPVLIDGSHSRLLVLTDNEVFVAIPHDLKHILWILRVDPVAEEFRSSGLAPNKGDDAEQKHRSETKNQIFHRVSPMVLEGNDCEAAG